MYPTNFHAQKFKERCFRHPCQKNSSPSQVLLFASPETFRKGFGEETLWQHQSESAQCLRENTEHSLRHWKVPQNSTLHRWIQAVNFKECWTLIHPESNSDFYEHWRQIHEFGSATAACEILHRVTIDAKKRQESGAIIALPCTCYLCFTRSHPHSYPTPPS